MTKKKFSGGINLSCYNDFKEITLSKQLKIMDIPDKVIIPLSQHKGIDAKLYVNKGDIVKEGDIIGLSDGNFSASVHATINGVITDIREIELYNQKNTLAVEITKDNNLAQTPVFNKKQWENLTSDEIIKIIGNSGITGLGGAVFPTHIKLKNNTKIDTLIINGAECEPYISCDQMLMINNFDEILEGINIINKIINAENLYIGIEKKNHNSINAVQEKINKNNSKLQIKILGTDYPQGDEKLLIRSVTGRIVPDKGLPKDAGVLVLNVSTVFAIYEAVVLNKPLIERIITVSGEGIAEPQNIKVRFGTPISEVIKKAGGFSSEISYLVIGGPMMGLSLKDLSLPVTKGTLGIIAFSHKLNTIEEKNLKCIKCSRCIEACPFGIQPQLLYELIRKKNYKKAEKYFLKSCKECGCCDYVCPAKIPLVDFFIRGKKELNKINTEAVHAK